MTFRGDQVYLIKQIMNIKRHILFQVIALIFVLSDSAWQTITFFIYFLVGLYTELRKTVKR